MAKKQNILDLGESLVVEKMKTLKKSFAKAITLKNALTVYSKEISEIDLTGVQLLQHMLQQAQIKGKGLNFDISINKEQQLMLERNGFSNLLETIIK